MLRLEEKKIDGEEKYKKVLIPDILLPREKDAWCLRAHHVPRCRDVCSELAL